MLESTYEVNIQISLMSKRVASYGSCLLQLSLILV